MTGDNSTNFDDIIRFNDCPPKKFCGRKKIIEKIINRLKDGNSDGSAILISGLAGTGKTSLITKIISELKTSNNITEDEILRKKFPESPDTAFYIYKDIVEDLDQITRSNWFDKAINTERFAKNTKNFFDKFSKSLNPISVSGLSTLGSVITDYYYPNRPEKINELVFDFIEVMSCCSDFLVKQDKKVYIFIDDVQYASDPDFAFLVDIIRNVPPHICIIMTFRNEYKFNKKFSQIKYEVMRYNHILIKIVGFDEKEIQELAQNRFNFEIDIQIANELRERINDPLSLVWLLKFFKDNEMEINYENIVNHLPNTVKNSAELIYDNLTPEWQHRVNILSIIRPPIHIDLISCILEDTRDLITLKKEFQHHELFNQIDHETFEISQTSVREYCLNELPKKTKRNYHFKAIESLKKMKDAIPENSELFDLQIVEHLFLVGENDQALDWFVNIPRQYRPEEIFWTVENLERHIKEKFVYNALIKTKNRLLYSRVLKRWGQLYFPARRNDMDWVQPWDKGLYYSIKEKQIPLVISLSIQIADIFFVIGYEELRDVKNQSTLLKSLDYYKFTKCVLQSFDKKVIPYSEDRYHHIQTMLELLVDYLPPKSEEGISYKDYINCNEFKYVTRLNRCVKMVIA